MKTLIQEEGFDLPLSGRFGNPMAFFMDFKLVFGYKVNHSMTGDLEVRLFYWITEDGYLQVCRAGSETVPIIIAQFLRSKIRLRSQVLSILKEFFCDARLLGLDYPPIYTDGGLYSRMEFERFLGWLDNKYQVNRVKALENPPSAVPMLNAYHLMPRPDGRDIKTWVCICPGCHRTTLTFSKDDERWSCKFCHLSGQDNWDLWTMITFIQKKRAVELINNHAVRN